MRLNSFYNYNPHEYSKELIMTQEQTETWSAQAKYRYRTVESKRYLNRRPAFIALSLEDLTLPQHPTHDGGVRQHDLQQCVTHALETITPREERVVRRVLGIGYDASTLEEIGWSMDVSGSRIREIYLKAIRKLRHPGRSKYLREFLVNE